MSLGEGGGDLLGLTGLWIQNTCAKRRKTFKKNNNNNDNEEKRLSADLYLFYFQE